MPISPIRCILWNLTTAFCFYAPGLPIGADISARHESEALIGEALIGEVFPI
jgi:hypothetical protein